MASRINADSSNGLQLISDSSGEVQIQSNGVTVATINSSGLSMNSGTLAGNGPAFSAYQTSGQSISTGTGTILVFDATDYDLTGDFNTSTYKFTPSVAGYYLFTGFIRINVLDGKLVSVRFQKNEVQVKNVIEASTGVGADNGWSFSTVVYANGTTDNFRLQLFHTSGVTETTTAGSAYTTFQGTLVRAA